MEEKKNSELKSNVISGMSSSAGAAVGVVAGSAISQELNAAELTEEEVPVNEEPVQQPVQQTVQTTEETPVPTPEVKPEEPEPVVIPEAEVEVVGYETLTVDDGSQIDVAVASVDGELVMVADIDQDGKADVMAADLNGNGQLEENEIIDVSGTDIAMEPLQQAAVSNMEDTSQLALNDDSDYINNADVNDYIA